MIEKKLPEGTQDFLPRECAIKRDIEQKLRECFQSGGFSEVETPTFEYYDNFTRGTGRYLQENMFKFFDLKGRILVLRPDLTVPIARIAATRMGTGNLPLRLFYIQNAFGVSNYNAQQRGEYTQAGIEFIGKSGSDADAEAIAAAIKGILCTGLTDFKIELGQVDFFKGITEEAGLTEEQTEEIRYLIDTKNTIELEYTLTRMGVNENAMAKLMELPGLFGGREALNRARELSENEKCCAAIDNLEEAYSALEDFGYGEYVMIDLGMLNNLNYYSGIVFRGITEGMGFPILSGGRYDSLLDEFGASAPAVGFALGIKRIMVALERKGLLAERENKCIIVTCNSKDRAKAYAYAERLRGEGKRVIFEAGLDEDEKRRYSETEDIGEIITVEGGEMKCR